MYLKKKDIKKKIDIKKLDFYFEASFAFNESFYE